MALPDILTGLLQPAAYPHACGVIQLVETHISWVLLTGDYAYKIKKPVRLPFVDFSTIERRQFFCREELRCNRRFAPELYLDVVAVCSDSAGALTVAGSSPVLEWAVKMHQFPPAQQLDRLLEAGQLTVTQLQAFGVRLATVHAGLPRHAGSVVEVADRVLAPVRENFATLVAVGLEPEALAWLTRIRTSTDRLVLLLGQRFAARLEDGHTRECHGDLHLGNLVVLHGAVTAFDCLEFDANLRWIDTQSDVAFLFMDCLVRGRADLGYAFLDAYLDASGDYEGIALLGFYAVYRALVRAKVAAIELGQAASPAQPARERLQAHLRWADGRMQRPAGGVLLMCGVSGSGKSFLAERLARLLPAVRIRSDIARRHLDPDARAAEAGNRAAGAGSARLDEGRYAPQQVMAVYAYLAELLDGIVAQGETVILDATFLDRAARRAILERAQRAGWPALIVHCTAPAAVLEARIAGRKAAGGDASEADLTVLERQLARQQAFAADEPVLEVDTSIELDDGRLNGIRDAIRERLPAFAS